MSLSAQAKVQYYRPVTGPTGEGGTGPFDAPPPGCTWMELVLELSGGEKAIVVKRSPYDPAAQEELKALVPCLETGFREGVIASRNYMKQRVAEL